MAMFHKYLCAVAAFLAIAAPSWAAKKMYPMNVPAAGVKTITFDVQEGDFILRGDPNVSEIQMRVQVDRYWLFKLGEKGILEKLIHVSGQGSDALTVRTEIDPSWKNWGRAEYPIDFEVVVPAGANLNVHDTSGKIEISEMRGEVAIDDTSGTLRVESVAGPLRIKKESGDIHVIDVAGAVTIDSKSGQMRLDRVGALDVLRSDGNVDITDAQSANVRNTGGNIYASSVREALNIDDESGEIRVQRIGGPVTIHDTSGQIRASQTGPVTVYDTSGDVTVERAASLDIRSKESGAIKVKQVSGKVRAPAGFNVQRY